MIQSLPNSPEADRLTRPHAVESLVVALHLGLLSVALVFFALHFVHLTADFPNFSRWMDWSKYTDEGWYGDAAIRHFELGHWYLAGDFNPAVALPVWPLLEAALFAFTGVKLAAVRALTVCVFGCILIAAWLLVAHSATSDGMEPSGNTSGLLSPGALAGSVAVLLLACNPFCFVFTRLAILEPLLILLALLALLAAQACKPVEDGTSFRQTLRLNRTPIACLGILLPLLVLTKTTGIFLFPAIAWMLFATLGHRLRPFVSVSLPSAALGLSLWLAYFLLFVHPHYLLDYRYLFSANGYTHISRSNYASVLASTAKDGRWFGPVLYFASIASALFSLLYLRRLRRDPLIPALLLWALGYVSFLAYHNNLQPRYYLVVAIPLTLLVPVVIRDLLLPRIRSRRSRAALLSASALLFLLISVPDGIETIRIVTHPQYTLLSAARQIRDFIVRDHQIHPNHSDLVLSISGSELSLMTGLHSICDDFGTLELADRARLYNPGWYVSWNLIEDDKMDALDSLYHVVRVATFPAMDDPERNLLVLYRLAPANSPEEDHPRLPRGLRHPRGKVGQQPSTIQLEH